MSVALNSHGMSVVAEILAGTRSHKDLKMAFDWSATVQGHSYWSRERQATNLSTEVSYKLIVALRASHAAMGFIN